MYKKIGLLLERSKKLPTCPGVYIMKQESGKIIYIGKAKILKNRVSSYFLQIKNHDPKVLKMVENVFDFDFIVTNSEFEALVLECSLIKQEKPKYNILLKDDKGYYYIKMNSKADYPRIVSEKNNHDKNFEYIGPYTSFFAVSQIVDQANSIFKLPTCSRVFPKDFKKERPCLNYYINLCNGTCKGNIDKEEYRKSFLQAKDYIKGGSEKAVIILKKKMEDHSNLFEYEQAGKYRDKINAIKKILLEQKVVLESKIDLDVIGYYKMDENVCINILKFRKGRLSDKEEMVFSDIYNVEDLISDMVSLYYSKIKEIPSLIISQIALRDTQLITKYLSNLSGKKVSIKVPEKGDKKYLLDMAIKNSKELLFYNRGKVFKGNRVLEELKSILGLKNIPIYIEAYDISNIGDCNIVCGMVVFKDGSPYKKGYRRFAMKDIKTQDDYGSMKEALVRRFERYKKEHPTEDGFGKKPDLILLDGGRGHVSIGESIMDEFGLDIPVFGMVKDSKHKTKAISKVGKEIDIFSDKSVFKFISNIQDEVHRYSINYQRKLDKKRNINLILKSFDGIGEKKSQNLIIYFKTIENIETASPDKISQVAKISVDKAKLLQKFIKDSL